MSQFRSKTLDIGCFSKIRNIRDHTKRKVYEANEPERQALRYIIRNTTFPQRVRAQAQLQLSQMHCYTRFTQIKNRCIMGGKGRGVFSDFRMGRYQFRINALAGNIPGVKKASCTNEEAQGLNTVSMFRRQENTLDADAKYPLGYFVDVNGCIRRIEAPEHFFDFFYTNNERHNEVRGEAMRVCQRREVMSRLAALGLKELYLPTRSNSKPIGPHVPILAPPAEVLKTRKRVIVIINDDTYQDLGILAYRELQREGGLNGGSVVSFVKGLVNRTQADASPDHHEKLARDGARIEKDEHIPGLIVLNTGQLLYSHKFNKALSMRSWTALPRKSITHDPVKIHEVENRVEGHRTPSEHIKTVFNTVIKNRNFVSPEAEVYVVAIENGVEKLIEVLDQNFYSYADRITAMAFMQSTVGGHQIRNPDVKAFLHTRARHWETFKIGSADPTQCKAVPADYISKQPSTPIPKSPVNWLETVDGGAGLRADTPLASIPEVKLAIAATKESTSEDGFQDATPICPVFGGGETWVGECVFTQSIVQQAVLEFFEDVALDPKGFCNPDFKFDNPEPSSDGPLALSAASQYDAIPEDMLNPEKKAVLAAQEELSQLEAAFNAVPQDNPDLAPGLLRLRNRIKKKDAELRDLEEKALATGALGAGAAQHVRDGWKHQTNGEEWTEKKPGTPISFAGVQADSNVVASAGCLDTVEEELAKLELEED
ncbi:uncharacterized protein N0V89_001930 [Didymosphaeria variabile]|uniref:Arb2 domain-containing protein n=1 Tax=Didymosphaeria variabile TaxID=1932322 RepID=A0A9W8XQR3_9PLEO|nr:uncharacterized protein N0V89_001930 [Didymosphaeria variabile]KAJ4357355.1 hypothetical protein N0V89_001930 [Didymosphaeria variabile]